MSDSTENRLLAIDYGSKRIGLALSDPLMIFAYAYKTILNDANLWENLTAVINEKKVSKILLGIPDSDAGGKTSVKEQIIKFKEDIEKKFRIEVILWDESYTSSIAADNILESVNKRSKRRDKSLLDRNAAAVILQEYLDSK